MGKGYDKNKNFFYKGLILRHGMICFKGKENSAPYITDVVSYYNRILRENKELENKNEILEEENMNIIEKCEKSLNKISINDLDKGLRIVHWLNDLNDENEQLKDKYNEQSVQYEGLEEQVERLLDFKDNVFNLIDELIKKAEKDVEDLRKDAYEKGYAYNPYYYWGVAHGLEKLKKELEE